MEDEVLEQYRKFGANRKAGVSQFSGSSRSGRTRAGDRVRSRLKLNIVHTIHNLSVSWKSGALSRHFQ